MGFFSWECKCCGKSIINGSATCPVTLWQTEYILFTKYGDVMSGSEYEGYGFGDYSECDDFTVYHKACWEYAGKPGYQGPARYASDQGFFFDDKAHDFAPPGTENPEEWVRVRKTERYKLRQTQELKTAINDLYSMWYEVFGYPDFDEACT
jgi:hypothetical protein